MKEKRRRPVGATFQLEALDERLVLSTVGAAHAAEVAMAHHAAAHAHTHVAHHTQHVSKPKAQHKSAFTFAGGAPMSVPVYIVSGSNGSMSGSVRTAAARSAAVSSTANPTTTPTAVFTTGSPTTTMTTTGPSQTSGGNTATQATTTSTTTTSAAVTTTNGPVAKAGSDLNQLYQQFQSGGEGGVSPGLAARLEISGSNVQVDVRGTGDFNTFIAALKNLGMNVTATDARTETVEGSLPIAQLVAVSQISQTTSIMPVYRPGL